MRLFALAAPLALAAAPLARTAHAQDTTRATSPFATLVAEPPVVVGSKVLVRPGRMWKQGHVSAIRGDTLVIGRAVLRPAYSVALDTTSQVQVMVGKGSRAHGAVMGMLAGVGVSAACGLAVVGAFHGKPARDWRVARDIAILSLPAAVASGALIGALVPGERWARVTLSLRTNH